MCMCLRERKRARQRACVGGGRCVCLKKYKRSPAVFDSYVGHDSFLWDRTIYYGVATSSRLLKLYVSFAEYRLFYRALVQKRRIVLFLCKTWLIPAWQDPFLHAGQVDLLRHLTPSGTFLREMWDMTHFYVWYDYVCIYIGDFLRGMAHIGRRPVPLWEEISFLCGTWLISRTSSIGAGDLLCGIGELLSRQRKKLFQT